MDKEIGIKYDILVDVLIAYEFVGFREVSERHLKTIPRLRFRIAYE